MSGSIDSLEMEDVPNNVKDRAKEGTAAAIQFDDLILNAVLLVCKGKHQGCCRHELSFGASDQIKVYWSNKELDMSKREGGCVRGQVNALA